MTILFANPPQGMRAALPGAPRMAHKACPCIGLNADFVPGGKEGPAQILLGAGYVDALLAAGSVPVIVPPLGKDGDFGPWLERLDGFVLTGGLDIDPRRMGLLGHPAVQPLPERRDESDRALVSALLKR